MGENRENSGKAVGLPAGSGPVSFGHVRFDTRTGELQRNGIVARLTPKAAAVLVALLERAPELITREELLARVWNGKVVGDEALTSCIQELRRALDDNARQPRYLETRHRRGYRLIAPLHPANSCRLLRAPQISPGKPSLAVLPFDNLSPDKDQDYFADGIVEDMTTALSRIGAFFVVARGSSFTFKGRNVPARGSRPPAGCALHRRGQCWRAGAGVAADRAAHRRGKRSPPVGGSLDGEMADVFDLQDRIVGRIVGAISPSVRAAEIARAGLKRPGQPAGL